MFLKILEGNVLDALKELEDKSVNLIVTSPPYWGLRDYGHPDQIGLESSLEEYLNKLLVVTSELKRVLKKDGVMFWNHGDSYGGSLQGYGAKHASKTGFQKPAGLDERYIKNGPPPISKYKSKCMIMQNYRLALRMIDEQGWILRNVIIWQKINHMPSSVKDRFTNAYEPIFMFVKSRKYYFNLDSVREPYKDSTKQRVRYSYNKYKGDMYGTFKSSNQRKFAERLLKGELKGKNPGDVWSISTKPFKGAHFAVFPPDLVERAIKAACPPGGIVLDPFLGSGTTMMVARKMGCSCIGIEINSEYVKMAKERVRWGIGLDVDFSHKKIQI